MTEFEQVEFENAKRKRWVHNPDATCSHCGNLGAREHVHSAPGELAPNHPGCSCPDVLISPLCDGCRASLTSDQK